ncbi:MAG: glycosyltransferase [Sedimentisphaerales bacterium]|nr:glycosyltransferase [Sedimentisphaerales bacterium]
MMDALLQADWRVVVCTAGEAPRFELGSEHHHIVRLSPQGRIPQYVTPADKPRKKLPLILPGPDPNSRFVRAVFNLAPSLIGRYRPDILMASGPPFSLFTASRFLGMQFNIPLVLDFRDAWHTPMPWPYRHRWQRKAAIREEALCLRQASRLIAATEVLQRSWQSVYGVTISNISCIIRHGFTPLPADFPSDLLPEACRFFDDAPPFLLVYTGQLRGIDIMTNSGLENAVRGIGRFLRRILLGATFCEHLNMDWMSLRYLLPALAQAGRECPDFKNRFRLVLAGQPYTKIDDLAEKYGLKGRIIQTGFLPADQIDALLRRSQLALLMLYGIKSCPNHWCVPSKLYGYLGAGRPILSLLPEGEALDIAKKSQLAITAPPNDPVKIKEAILSAFQRQQDKSVVIKPDWDYIQQFSAEVQMQRFRDCLESIPIS